MDHMNEYRDMNTAGTICMWKIKYTAVQIRYVLLSTNYSMRNYKLEAEYAAGQRRSIKIDLIDRSKREPIRKGALVYIKK